MKPSFLLKQSPKLFGIFIAGVSLSPLASAQVAIPAVSPTPENSTAPEPKTGEKAPTQVPALEVSAPKVKTEDTSAGKLPLTLHETPRSVSIMDAERIREQNFRTPVDTFYYTPGIFPNSTASGGYHFIARGFRMSPDETRLDGFTGFYVGGGQSPQGLYGVDRIVSLRGPSGLLYGAAALPGGSLNIITKKPLETPFTRLDLTASTYAGGGLSAGERGSFSAELDSTGPITKDGRILYRSLIAGDNSSQYTADVLNQTRYYHGALTFKLDPEGLFTLTPVVQFAHNVRPAGAAMVISPSTSLSTSDGSFGPVKTSDLSPFDTNLYEGGRTDDMLVAGFDFLGKPSDDLTLSAGYRHIDYSTDINQWSPVVTTAAQRAQLATFHTVSRTQAKSMADRASENFDVHGTYEFQPANNWKDLVQAGLNGRFYRSQSRTATGPNAPQSPLNIYTGAAAPVVDNLNTWGPVAVDDDLYWNSYLQNQAAFLDERLVLTVGLGYGQQHYNDAPTRKGDVTPNASLLYHLTPQLAVYTSYATSYSPSDPTREDFAGNRNFRPETGVNHEVGVKYDTSDRRSSVAVALFRTERQDVVTQDTSLGPVNGNGNIYYLQGGGQEAQGAELNGETHLTDNWRLNATFAYLDASYGAGAFPRPVAKTPEYSWSLFTRYDVTDGPLRDLGLNLGVVWQDERLGGNGARTAASPDPLMLPSFFRVDAGLHYKFNRRWDASLNVANVLDETILVDGTTGANLQVAAPRTFSVRIGCTF